MNTQLTVSTIIQLIKLNFHVPFNEFNAKLLFDYYTLNRNNNIITTNEIRSLLFDILCIKKWPLIIPNETLHFTVKKLQSSSCKFKNNSLSVSWKEFKLFFKRKCPINTLFNLLKLSLNANLYKNFYYNTLETPAILITIKPIAISYDNKYNKYGENKWKLLLKQLVPQATNMVLKFVDQDIYALLIGPLALIPNDFITINVNNTIYALKTTSFDVFNNIFQSDLIYTGNFILKYTKKITIYLNDSRTIECCSHVSFGTLLFMIKQKLNIPNECNGLLVVINGLIVKHNEYQYKHLDALGIFNNSSVFIVVCKDYAPLTFNQLNSYNIANDNSKIIQNTITMNCGHSLSICDLYSSVLYQLKRGKIAIKCTKTPLCNKPCSYLSIRNVLISNLNGSGNDKNIPLKSILHLDEIIAYNMFKRHNGRLRSCPKCKSVLYTRREDKDCLSQCPVCKHSFCYRCKGHTCTKTACKKDIIRIYINIYTNIYTTYIDVNGCTSIKQLVLLIKNKFKIAVKYNILLINNHLIVNESIDGDKHLRRFNIINKSCLILCICSQITTNTTNNNKVSVMQKNFRQRCYCMSYQLQYKDKIKYIEDLDILTFEKNKNCIQMRCGHGMTKQTLYDYSLSQIKDKKTMIKCPHVTDNIKNTLCANRWYYPMIKRILHLNDDCKSDDQIPLDDILKLEMLIGLNTINNEYKTRNCPQCKCLLYQNHDRHNEYLTVCPLCNHSFCWNCDDDKCSLYSCSKMTINLKDEVLKILSNCELKKIGSVSDVPSIRCCPKCLQLITHTDACKHVACTSCKISFCFVCMKIKLDGKWPCGSHSSICPIAPIEIPNVINNI